MCPRICISKLILFTNVLVFCLGAQAVFAQDLLDDIKAEETQTTSDATFSETINIISRTGKVFILSNDNQLLNKGDFITLILKAGGPVARAVVAKTHNGQSGIKVLKVYSLARWSQLRKGLAIDLIRGDDSFLFVEKKAVAIKNDEKTKIESEEDLFNEKAIVDEAIVEEDISGFYKDNRYIKPDNIVTAGYNQLTFKDEVSSDTIAGNQWNFSWAYQFADNYWVEGLYGRTQLDGFPAQGNQTIVNNFTARLKFTFKAPLYSYLMPYIGVQSIGVSSPDAGVITGTTADDLQRAALEEKTIDELEKTQLVLGVTVLRRLVPGWFLKLDLGSDILSIGFGIEF